MRRKTLYRAARAAMAIAVAAGLALATCAPARAQSNRKLQLWTDPVTGQVFTRPGKGRVPLAIPYSEISRRVQQVEKQQQAVTQEVSQLKANTQKTSVEVQKMQPAWQDFADRWMHKFSIGVLAYADYGLYTHTGYGPQFFTQVNPPGPGNNLYNSFDVSRAYLNFIFKPDENFTFRVTPNIYRAVGSASAVSNSKSSSVGSNLDGSLNYRLKYAYLDWNTPFRWNDWLRKDKITFGQQANPLVAWEEDMYEFRYVNLTPWNFLSLSSTQAGLAMKGPITVGTREVKYADYDMGVYTNGTFHAPDNTNTKQVMGRISLYPFGGTSEFYGMGFTGFYDYGYSNNAPDQCCGKQSTSLYRLAALVHYETKNWGIAGEFDDGKNAFSAGNLFSASAPLSGSSESTLASLFQSNSRTHQLGFDFFGRVKIPRTPFTLFGMFEQLWANTKVSVNPFDFQRVVFGVDYQYSKHLRFALDSQNILFYHKQFTVSQSELARFDQSTAAKYPSGIAFAVPRDTHAIFANMQFSY